MPLRVAVRLAYLVDLAVRAGVHRRDMTVRKATGLMGFMGPVLEEEKMGMVTGSVWFC